MSKKTYTLTNSHTRLSGITYDVWDEYNNHIIELKKSHYAKHWCVSDEYIMDHFVMESDDMDDLIAFVTMEMLK